ncbi:MAG: hypothetical protein KBA71_11935 [Opitutaceae bacterium]|nr:hypothetical protein [Opitutaceae bacterium]
MNAAEKLLIAFFILSAFVALVFLAVARSTRLPVQPQDEASRFGYAIRGRWFVFLLVGLIGTFLASLPFFPYMRTAAALQPAMRVPVEAWQFLFIMPDQLPVNQRIIFEVKTPDVTHGFGIYAPDGQLIAQTQAMPDYVNYLDVTFRKPGRYFVRCLEFCGMGHPIMQKEITVGDPTAAGGSRTLAANDSNTAGNHE